MKMNKITFTHLLFAGPSGNWISLFAGRG